MLTIQKSQLVYLKSTIIRSQTVIRKLWSTITTKGDSIDQNFCDNRDGVGGWVTDVKSNQSSAQLDERELNVVACTRQSVPWLRSINMRGKDCRFDLKLITQKNDKRWLSIMRLTVRLEIGEENVIWRDNRGMRLIKGMLIDWMVYPPGCELVIGAMIGRMAAHRRAVIVN